MSFQAGNSTWWYVADLRTRGPEWSGVVPSSVVTGSHFASHGTTRSFVVRILERVSELRLLHSGAAPRLDPAPMRHALRAFRPGWPGVLLHEAVGHGLEADFNRKKTSAF